MSAIDAAHTCAIDPVPQPPHVMVRIHGAVANRLAGTNCHEVGVSVRVVAHRTPKRWMSAAANWAVHREQQHAHGHGERDR